MEVSGSEEPIFYIRGVRLCTPDQDLGDDPNSFNTEPVEVENLGLVRLAGDKSTQIEKQFPKALTLLNGTLIKLSLDEYSHMGLYDAILGTDGRNPHHPVICRIGADENRDLLEAFLNYGRNEEVDPGAIVANWHVVGERSDELLPFLIPKDSKFLSELKFSFIGIPKLQQS